MYGLGNYIGLGQKGGGDAIVTEPDRAPTTTTPLPSRYTPPPEPTYTRGEPTAAPVPSRTLPGQEAYYPAPTPRYTPEPTVTPLDAPASRYLPGQAPIVPGVSPPPEVASQVAQQLLIAQEQPGLVAPWMQQMLQTPEGQAAVMKEKLSQLKTVIKTPPAVPDDPTGTPEPFIEEKKMGVLPLAVGAGALALLLLR